MLSLWSFSKNFPSIQLRNMELDRFFVDRTSWCNVWYTYFITIDALIYFTDWWLIVRTECINSQAQAVFFNQFTPAWFAICDRKRGRGNGSKTPFRLEVNGNGIKINWIDRSSVCPKELHFIMFFSLYHFSSFSLFRLAHRD